MTTQTLGIDFSLARPDGRAVAAAGYRFVLGYLSNNPPKNLTGPQIAAYRAAGLQVGLVWETTADRALAGASAGASDGATAEGQANAVGYPPACVLFAAVDFGATVAQINGPIRAYMQAFSAATRRPVGVYGSYDVVSRLCTPGRPPVSYAWQTMAWSRDAAGNDQLWQPGHLYQRLSHSYPIAGSPVTGWDENVLLNPLPLMGAASAPTPGGNVATLDDQDLLAIYNTVWFGHPGAPLIPREREGGGEWPASSIGSMTARVGRDIVAPAAQAILDKVGAQTDVQAVADAILAKLPADQAQAVASLVLAGLNGAQINVSAPPPA